MRFAPKFAVSMLALAFMSSVSFAGVKISGTVTGKDGQPAKEVPVRLMTAPAKKDAKAPAAAPAAGEKKPKAAPLQETTTKTDGTFAFEKEVEDGSYVVQSGNKEAGQGRAAVKVEGGKAEKVSITLKEAGPKAPKAPKAAK